jgi:hypothetical protein
MDFINRVSTCMSRKRFLDDECLHPSCQIGYVQMPAETPEYIQLSNAIDRVGNRLKDLQGSKFADAASMR